MYLNKKKKREFKNSCFFFSEILFEPVCLFYLSKYLKIIINYNLTGMVFCS